MPNSYICQHEDCAVVREAKLMCYLRTPYGMDKVMRFCSITHLKAYVNRLNEAYVGQSKERVIKDA
ncbi:hypothetical protein ES705_48023 [subsurface metagenome]